MWAWPSRKVESLAIDGVMVHSKAGQSFPDQTSEEAQDLI